MERAIVWIFSHQDEMDQTSGGKTETKTVEYHDGPGRELSLSQIFQPFTKNHELFA